MEQYIQCGDIAENPLYVKELGIHIYTAEEFCYYIFNNTYLLGEDFIRQEVIDFFRVELHMPELADKIVKFYGSSADMGAVLVMIMREIGYYEENQIQQFQNRLDRLEQSEQETVVRSIGEDNEINLKISQDYLTQRKRAYCHMVMDE